jgi:hypothetical protein
MDMLDDGLPDLIAKIDDGSEFALVLAPASNDLEVRDARCIIRQIGTLGGRQLAYHELYNGKAGSGIYGDAAKIFEVARAAAESFSTSHLYKSFYKTKGFRWVLAREIDLPPHLLA